MNNPAGEFIKDRKSITSMFDRIARRYDFLNHFLSFRRDIQWRKKAVRKFKYLSAEGTVLDLCAGTGDMTYDLYNRTNFNGISILLDTSGEMLSLADLKFSKKNNSSIYTLLADAQEIPLKSGSLDGAMVAFGIRNLQDHMTCFKDIYRVLKSGGEFLILEFSWPDNQLLASIYGLYFFRILPLIGRLITGNRFAYSYLTSSVRLFAADTNLCKDLEIVGFNEINEDRLWGGIVSLLYARK